ncbi:hypothetical protein L596_029010 [Steinernema carpocapsae]|uniref:Uncharacterized protein n=1 Tax=Steinernema carpocapsae TaxID=34508 RepID=A0A4U5LTD0_STECR|nr:hypothetical protein L596_029010 [Steinernema carpocapsae]
MDCVPYVFIDSVIGSFVDLSHSDSILQISDLRWQNVFQDHSKNRTTFKIPMQSTEAGIKCIFSSQNRKRALSLREVLSLDSKFVRISAVRLIAKTHLLMKTLKKSSSKAILEFPFHYFIGQFLRADNVLHLSNDDIDCQRKVLIALHKQIYFSQLDLRHSGVSSEHFLIDQLDNSAHLRSVDLRGSWKQSIIKNLLEFMKNNKHEVSVDISSSDIRLDMSSLGKFVENWKSKGRKSVDLTAKTELTEEQIGQIVPWLSHGRFLFHQKEEKRAIEALTNVVSRTIHIMTFECSCGGADDRQRCHMSNFISEH